MKCVKQGKIYDANRLVFIVDSKTVLSIILGCQSEDCISILDII